MNKNQELQKNYQTQLSDAEFADMLLEKYPQHVIAKVFEFYPLKCANSPKTDYGKLDQLIEEYEGDCENPRKKVIEIIGLVRKAATGTGEPIPIVERVKEFIRENQDRDCSVKEIARRLGVSAHYMMHRFSLVTGMTVTNYKNEIKLEKAKKMLVETQLSVSDIAMECWFDNSSYFSEVFKQFEHVSPTEYRTILRNTKRDTKVLQLSTDKDIILYSMLPSMKLLAENVEQLDGTDTVRTYELFKPNEQYSFVHETAIVEYHGVLFAAWYACPRFELMERSPIVFCRSFDQGKTWDELKIVADDPEGNILYCPPVFGTCDDKLYMLLNEMVSADHMHALDLYIYNEKVNQFEFVWSRPIPFKLNTNVYHLDNGKLILPGRIAELDGFPITPAVLISDSGKMDGDWRLVKLQEDGYLPDGSRYQHPEVSLIAEGKNVYAFVRNDFRNIPMLYQSQDYGEHWTGPIALDIPFSNSKIYSGTLEDGRHYVIGNIQPGRSKLEIFFTEPGTMTFARSLVLQDGANEQLGYGKDWHYPSVWESNGKLFVIYTMNIDGWMYRGSVVSVIDLKCL